MIPQKLATYFRLCDEAYKRMIPMVLADKGERYERWENAYDYKRKQMEAAQHGILGHNAYFDCIVSLAMNHIHSEDYRAAKAALDAAKQILIELNKE